MDREYLIGVDVNSNKIEAGLVDLNGKVLKKIILPSEATKGKNKVIENIATAVKKIEKSRILGIGIAIPGMVNKEKGIVLEAEMPGWQNLQLKKILEEKLNIPVYIESVGNCFTLAEYKCAHERKTENIVGIIVGNMIHSGIIIDGKLLRGSTNAAGAISHIIIEPDGAKCECGNNGCLQAHVSISAIEKKYKQKTRKCKNFEDILKEKSKHSNEIMSNAGVYLGIGLANIANLLNPEAIVVKGPVFENERILEVAEKEMSKRINAQNKKVKIIKSKLEDSGILGAASIVM